MTRQDLPEIADIQPGLRPGGARGAPFPDLEPGARMVAWLESGDVVHLDALGADEQPDRPVFPWNLVVWWCPR